MKTEILPEIMRDLPGLSFDFLNEQLCGMLILVTIAFILLRRKGVLGWIGVVICAACIWLIAKGGFGTAWLENEVRVTGI